MCRSLALLLLVTIAFTPCRAEEDDDGFLGGVKKFGRKAGRIIKNVADDVGDTARRAGRSAEREARKLGHRLSHRHSDLTTESKLPAHLSLVIPGTDLGVRVLKQVDKYGHYDPVWAHSPDFVKSISKRWPDSQVKLFTWLSGPDDLTIDSAANGLFHFVSTWRKEHPGKLVRIYAHSNGGNVALRAAARHKMTTDGDYFFDELITNGTPIRPSEEATTKFAAIRRLIIVFSRNDWVAGNVYGNSVAERDPRRGVVPKIYGCGHTPELAVWSTMFNSAPIQSPTTHGYIIPIDVNTATTRSLDQVIKDTYGQDFFERRANRTIGEIDASDIVDNHSAYNRPEVNIAILERVNAYDAGKVPDATGDEETAAAK